ncbi:MAG: hypothetical protein AAF191_07030, partial [Verrucomicrobiota bacterium]
GYAAAKDPADAKRLTDVVVTWGITPAPFDCWLAPPAEGVLVQAIRLGDQAIVSLPFEVFVEIGLEIKEKSPFPHTMLIALANGGYGYLPTPEQHKLGGYETWISSARFETNASDQLTDELLEMLGELHALPAQ